MVNRKLLLYAAKVKADLFEAVILKYLLFLANLAFVWLSAWTVENVLKIGESHSFSKIAIFIPAVIIIALIRFFINIRSSQNVFNIARKVQTDIRQDIYNKVLDLEIEYLEKSGTSSLVSITVEGVEMLEVYFARYLPQLFYSVTVPFVLFAFLFNIEWKAPLVMILSVWLIPVSIIFFMKKAQKIMQNFWNTYENMSKDFLENIQGLVTLKLYNRDSDISEIMRENSEIFRNSA
jgi:ATP-binding cassette, subfamily C, bacterial